MSVKFFYYSSIGGTVINPKIYKKRPDLRWADVVSKRHQVAIPRKYIFHLYVRNIYMTSSYIGRKVVYQAPVSWLLPESRRGFFDEFAQEKGFNPLVPANWYKVTSMDIQKKKV